MKQQTLCDEVYYRALVINWRGGGMSKLSYKLTNICSKMEFHSLLVCCDHLHLWMLSVATFQNLNLQMKQFE